MTEYRVRRTSNNDYLAHAGKKGSRWGYTNGKRNGNRTAEGEKPVYGPSGAPYGPNQAPVSYGPRNQRVITRRTESLKNEYDTRYDKDGTKNVIVYKGKADQFKDKVEKSTSNLGQKVRDAVIGKEGKTVSAKVSRGTSKSYTGYGPENRTQYKYGSTTNKQGDTTTVRKSDSLLSKNTVKVDPKTNTVHTTKNVGKIEQAVDKAESYVKGIKKKITGDSAGNLKTDGVSVTRKAIDKTAVERSGSNIPKDYNDGLRIQQTGDGKYSYVDKSGKSYGESKGEARANKYKQDQYNANKRAEAAKKAGYEGSQEQKIDQVKAKAKKTAKKIKGASEKAVDRGVDYVSSLWKKLRSN